MSGLRFTQKLKAVALSMGGKIPEVNEVVDGRKVVVEQAAAIAFEHRLHFGFQQRRPTGGNGFLLQEVLQEPACLLDAPLRNFDGSRVVERHIAQHLPRVPSGQGVVADEADSVRRQPFAADGKQAIADIRRDPRIQTMSHDVVELAVPRANIPQIRCLKGDVLEAERSCHAACGGDGGFGEVDAKELGARQSVCHGDQVAAVAAADFQHTAGNDRREVHAQQRANGCQAVRVRAFSRIGGISDLIVRIAGHSTIVAAMRRATTVGAAYAEAGRK